MSLWFASNIVLLQATVTTFLLALGIQFSMRMGVVSFAAVGYYGIGAYTTGYAVTRLHWTTVPAIVLGVVFATIVAVLLGLVVQRLNGLYLAMTTIAFDLIVVVLAGNLTPITGGQTGMYGVVGTLQFWHLLIITAVVIALFVFSERGAIGRRIEAVHDDVQLASSLGINVARHRLLAFLVSGVVASLGGSILVLLRTTVTPDAFGFQLVVLALTVIVVGGSRSWAGAFIGAIIFTWLPLILAFAGDWRNVIYGLIVVIAAVYLPGGLWSVILRVVYAVRARLRRPVPLAEPSEDEPVKEIVFDAPAPKNGARS